MRDTGVGEGMGTYESTGASANAGADGRALFAAVRSVLTRVDAHAARAQRRPGGPGSGQGAADQPHAGAAPTDGAVPGTGADHPSAKGAAEPVRRDVDAGAAAHPRQSELTAGGSTPTPSAE